MNSKPEKLNRQMRQAVKPSAQTLRTSVIVESAMMVALGFVLSQIPFFHMPWGGSVTCFSTLPIIVISFRHGLKWGVATAAVFGVIQALMGAGNVAAAGSFGAMLLCALLDYILAYSAVGLSGPIARILIRDMASGGRGGAAVGLNASAGPSGAGGSHAGASNAAPSPARRNLLGFLHPKAALAVGVILTGLMRLFCSFLSGVLIWGAWAPEGVPVWQYSLTYNAGWCLPDVAIVLFAAVALSFMPGARIMNLSESRK